MSDEGAGALAPAEMSLETSLTEYCPYCHRELATVEAADGTMMRKCMFCMQV